MIIKNLPFQDPCKVYEKLRSINSVLLESQKNGDYSYVALNPYLIFKSKGEKIEIIKKNKKIIKIGNPLKELEKIIFKNKVKRKKEWPLFYAGCVGYFGYDLARFIESKAFNLQKDDLGLPDIYLIFPCDILFFDHKNKILKLICKNKKDVKKIIEKIKLNHISNKFYARHLTSLKNNLKSNFTFNQYKKAINKCKKYIKTGHSFQIKISQRFQFKIKQDPWEVYKKLKKINPSPYAAFLNFKDCTIVSNSPERLIKVEQNNIETRPIGGTYPRGKNLCEDKKNIKKFMLDNKEKAEHNMLIDLERNDLGKVAKFGSIKLNEKKTIEKYSHLFHIVTNIKAKLAKNKNIFDCFKAMFPGGTITGCPKKRTIDIINEIEPIARGPYTGSIGFMNFSNELDLNIIIRTLIVKDGIGYIQTGGGIVADSDARKEYDETINKASAIFESIML